jgi:hypothetical protein
MRRSRHYRATWQLTHRRRRPWRCRNRGCAGSGGDLPALLIDQLRPLDRNRNRPCHGTRHNGSWRWIPFRPGKRPRLLHVARVDADRNIPHGPPRRKIILTHRRHAACLVHIRNVRHVDVNVCVLDVNPARLANVGDDRLLPVRAGTRWKVRLRHRSERRRQTPPARATRLDARSPVRVPSPTCRCSLPTAHNGTARSPTIHPRPTPIPMDRG